MSIKQFNIEFDKAIKVVIEASEKAIKNSVTKLASDIINSTPVDTGQLRANWQVSINNPAPNVLLGRTDKSGVNTINKIKSKVKRFKLKGKESKIFLSNNLDYASRIEFGHHSQQAPQGMVRVNLVKFSETVRMEATKNKK